MKKFYPLNALVTLLFLITNSLSAQVTTLTYSYTGSLQTFTVPGCVSSVSISCYGAQGASGTNGGSGGLGALVTGVYPVTSGNVLNIYVGGTGTITNGGYNGGGNGGGGTAGGGGGASDVRIGGLALTNRIITAGGGGGGGTGGCTSASGTIAAGNGGSGGGGNGVSGSTSPSGGGGGGATGSTGGAAGIGCSGFVGTAGANGATGIGGNGGGAPSCCCTGVPAGGGGGGGDIGGGGGGGGSAGTTGCSGNDKGGGGGGAGGTNFFNAAFTSTSVTNGVRNGNGQIIISYAPAGGVVTAAATSTLICSGASVGITASGPVTNYTWSTGSNSSSISVSPTTNTVYSVSSTNSVACISVSTVSVIVNSGLPSLSVNTSTNSTCLGKTATITASGANTYTWTNGVTNGVSFNPTLTTTYVVTGQNACGTSTAATTISIAPLSLSLSTTPTIICAGQAATINAVAAATSYTWLPINIVNTSNFIIVSPTVSTIYTVAVSDGTCFGVSTIQLSANPVPTISIVSSNTSVCQGESVYMSASGGLTYNWTPGNLSGSSVTVTPTSPTSYSVSGTNSFGCASGISTVVITLPSPTVSIASNNNFICVGDAVNLQASGANSYTWTNGPISSSFNPSPSVTTIYTVTGTTNSCSSTQTLQIDVFDPVVSIAGPTAVCSGQSAILIGNGASSYTWNPGSLPFATYTVPLTSTTVFSLSTISTSLNLNCASTNTFQVNVNPNPTVTAVSSRTAICKGEFVTITANGASTYSWSNAASGPSITVTSSLITTLLYTVTGTNSSGCSADGTIQIKVNPCTAINELNSLSQSVFVYPNPNNGEFTIQSKVEVDLKVLNETGQLVQNVKLNAANNKINISNLSPGIYFLVGEKNGSVLNQKIIVTK